MSKQANEARLKITPPFTDFADAHSRPNKCARAGCQHTRVDGSSFCAACIAQKLADPKFSKQSCDNLPTYREPNEDSYRETDNECAACHARDLPANYQLPTKPYSLVDAYNRARAATDSPHYADYNGHALTLAWNEFRGYYVLYYFWTERVILRRESDFRRALDVAKEEYAREGRGASLFVAPRTEDRPLAAADADLVPFTGHPKPDDPSPYFGWPDPAWKYTALPEVLFYEKHAGLDGTWFQALREASSPEEWKTKVESLCRASRPRPQGGPA
jgi:hypothetical protein